VISQGKYAVFTPHLQQYLKNLSINTERIEPNNHSRGGSHVERVIRSLKELMRMAFGYITNNPNFDVLGVSRIAIYKCWAEILSWAVTIVNLKPCPRVKEKSKFEVFRRIKPNMQNIRLLPIFSFVLVNRETVDSNSLSQQNRNVVGIYVGPHLGTPGAVRVMVKGKSKDSMTLLLTSRISSLSDGGGLNIYPIVQKGLRVI